MPLSPEAIISLAVGLASVLLAILGTILGYQVVNRSRKEYHSTSKKPEPRLESALANLIKARQPLSYATVQTSILSTRQLCHLCRREYI